MKLLFGAVAAAGLLAGSAPTASAQYVVPHRGHYHVVPSYAPPVYGGFGYSGLGYSGFGFGFSSGTAFGVYRPYTPGIGYGGLGYGGSGWGGYGHSHGHGHYHR